MVANRDYLVVHGKNDIRPLDRRRSNKISASLALHYGPALAPGTGMFPARQDGLDWCFDSHETSMNMMEHYVREQMNGLNRYAKALRRDDFAATMGGMPAQKLIYKFRKAMEERLTELPSRRIFRQNREVPPGVLQYEQFRNWDEGQAIVYAGGRGHDIPRVGTAQTSFLSNVRYLISAAEINWRENLSARFAGIDRTTRKTLRMRRVVAEIIDEWAWLGSDTYGIRGFFNHPYLLKVISQVPYTLASTDDAIINDFSGWARYAKNQSNGVFAPDTAMLAGKLESYLSTKFSGDNKDKNLLSLLKAANPHIKRWEILDRFNDIGGEGIHGMGFFKSMGAAGEVSLEQMNVMEMTMLPPDIGALVTDFYTVAATGGLNQLQAGDNLAVFVRGIN